MSLLIFDCDGVMIDVRKTYHPAIMKTANLFLKEWGYKTYTQKEILEFKFRNGINNDWDVVAFALVKKLGKWRMGLAVSEAVRILKKEKSLTYSEIVKQFDRVYYGLKQNEKLFLQPEFYSEFSGETLAIVTGRIKKDLVDSLKHFGIRKYFSKIYTEDDLPSPKFRKPHPYLLDKCIDDMQQNNEPVFFLGDAKADKDMTLRSGYRDIINFLPIDFGRKKIFQEAVRSKKQLISFLKGSK